ncbi:aminopeptidase M1-C-like [Hordeum vulgare subsp. vulgare]|uniref:aminopeptidase M1-C-like n=1 Tax=Hordeum vulgare subsp. vulgare TaxID=112509 RepID=UPI001D1A46AC|nr:aminopeptidase M1-C-like [Hordeum vulgare subsp. vulgare]
MQNVSSSNRSKYDSLRKLYKNLGDEDEKLRVLGTLCSSWDKDIVLESLNLIFTNEIPSYHAVYVLKGIGIDAREMTWSWLKENWDRVLKVIPERDLMWSIINDILPLFTTNDKAEEIAKVFTNYPDPEIQSALQEKLQMVRINMRWIDGIRSEPKLAHTVHELLHKP